MGIMRAKTFFLGFLLFLKKISPGKIFYALNYTHLIDINRYNSQYNLGLGNGNSGTIQSCPEVVECLNKQDFDAFVKHLEVSN